MAQSNYNHCMATVRHYLLIHFSYFGPINVNARPGNLNLPMEGAGVDARLGNKLQETFRQTLS